MKTEFPYPLERPDISILHPVPDAPNNGIGSEDIIQSDNREKFLSNNQWNTIDGNIESRVVNRNKLNSHIYTEKPIAVAYTPTEPAMPNIYDKFPMPHFGLSNTDSGLLNSFQLSSTNEIIKKTHLSETNPPALSNHRLDDDVGDDVNIRTEQDFQAPFQASVKVDSPSHGWSVIRKNDSRNAEEVETTTVLPVTASEFDIENFKPQLEGGFKPIYTFRSEDVETKVEERQE
ncbi:hypothetical protein WA026_021707 [Henosepilachna vigintioctopunctata]|uniref:Uncharacterized protein n=1 Tax=Henosepilachna vigintioctopunctata TaxID=420089 RepID=A0AAW1UGI1_9CUCU